MKTNVFATDFRSSFLADELGALRAEIRELQSAAKAIEDRIKESGAEVVDGAHYRVTVSYAVKTARVDWKAVAAKLNPSRQLTTAHTTVTVSDRLRVSAHKKLD